MPRIRYTLKDDFFELPFPHNLHRGINLGALPDCGFISQCYGNYALFLSNGKKFFNKAESYSLPLNANLFYEFARSADYPVIMNFLQGETHRKIKRDFDAFLKFSMLDFSSFIEKNVTNYFLDELKGKENLDLYSAILKFIIDLQFSFFFDYKLSEEQLLALCYFDDYFSFGSYINDRDELLAYYSFDAFTDCYNIYKKLRKDIFNLSRKCRFSHFIHELSNKGYSEVEFFDQFYNVALGGGSTNIAKMFVYLNNLIEEEDFSDLVQCSSKGDNLAYINSGLSLRELYRFLPFVKNQVVPPYLLRIMESDFCFEGSETIFQGKELYYYNSLENISDLLDQPLRFNPLRDNNMLEKQYSKSFGAGKHFCCGLDLANLWLHHLTYNLFKCGFKVESLRGIEHNIYNERFYEIKRISYICSIK
jgi:hypothetical protein